MQVTNFAVFRKIDFGQFNGCVFFAGHVRNGNALSLSSKRGGAVQLSQTRGLDIEYAMSCSLAGWVGSIGQ
jgi:hypothetical protein